MKGRKLKVITSPYRGILIRLIILTFLLELRSGLRLKRKAPRTGGSPHMPKILGRLLCLLGIHDFRVTEATFGFGPGGSVQKVQCKRCGLVTAQHG